MQINCIHYISSKFPPSCSVLGGGGAQMSRFSLKARGDVTY